MILFRMLTLWKLCSVFLISVLSQTAADSCAAKACSKGVFSYLPGKTYQFEYKSNIIPGSPDQKHAPVFSLELDAHLTVITPCDIQLKLRIPTGSVTDYPFSNDLQSKPLRFGFYNGKIGGICPDPTDSEDSLNVKRGILSMLHISAANNHGFTNGMYTEVGPSGHCAVTYSVSASGPTSWLLKKQRVASELCQFDDVTRNTLRLGLHHIEPTCEYMVRDGVLQAADCVEVHSSRPLRQESATPLTVRQSLRQVESYDSTDVDEIRGVKTLTRSSMGFTFSSAVNHAQTKEEALKALCDTFKSDVRPTTPSLFTDLVAAVRRTPDSRELEAFYQSILDGQYCTGSRKLFLDALPATGTEASVLLMKKILIFDGFEMTGKELWFPSLAMIPTPTDGMLETFLPLLSDARLPRSGLLSISALASNLCQDGKPCNETLVSQLQVTLLKRLNPTCNTTFGADVDKELLTLKAIANVKPNSFLTDVLQIIAECSIQKNSIRVAALEAIEKRSCNDTDSLPETVLRILTDNDDDAEIRIAAFKALMACPSKRTVGSVVDVYESLPQDSQVRSFMYSYLNQSKLTLDGDLTAPTGLGLLTSEIWKEEFTRSNMTATAEAEVVYVDSSIPRSAEAALKVELFGREYRLLEVGGRFEGISEMFADLSMAENWGDIMRYYLSGERVGVEDSRWPFKLQKQLKEFKKADVPDPSVFLRVLGNEIGFVTYRDLVEATQSFKLPELLWELSEGKEIDLFKNVAVMSEDMMIMTSVGIPLNLRISASASAKLKGSFTVDFSGMLSTDQTFKVAGNLSPSAAVQVVVQYTLPGGTNAVKSVATLHTSAAIGGSIEHNRQRFSWKVDLPRDKMELLSFSTEAYLIRDGKEQRINPNPSTANSFVECTGPLTSRLFGVEFCAAMDAEYDDINQAEDYSKLLPRFLEISLQKTDPTMKGYSFEFTREQSPNCGFSVMFDTPGSQTKRTTGLSYVLNKRNGTLTGALITPFKKLEITGIFRPYPMMVAVDLLDDSVRKYGLNFTLNNKYVDGTTVVQPRLVLDAPVIGKVEVFGDLVSASYFSRRADVTFRSRYMSGRTILSSDLDNGQLVGRGTLQYRLGHSTRNQEFNLNFKARLFPTKEGNQKLSITTSLESTEFPAQNTLVQLDVIQSARFLELLETRATIYRGSFQDEQNKIQLHAQMRMAKVDGRYNLTAAAGAECSSPYCGISAVYSQEWSPDARFISSFLQLTALNGPYTAKFLLNIPVARGRKFLTLLELSIPRSGTSSTFDHAKVEMTFKDLKDQSDYVTWSYPYQLTVETSRSPRFQTRGELGVTRNEGTLTVDISLGSLALWTSTSSLLWRPLTLMTRYTLLNNTGHFGGYFNHAMDWKMDVEASICDRRLSCQTGFTRKGVYGYSAFAVVRDLNVPEDRWRYGQYLDGDMEIDHLRAAGRAHINATVVAGKHFYNVKVNTTASTTAVTADVLWRTSDQFLVLTELWVKINHTMALFIPEPFSNTKIAISPDENAMQPMLSLDSRSNWRHGRRPLDFSLHSDLTLAGALIADLPILDGATFSVDFDRTDSTSKLVVSRDSLVLGSVTGVQSFNTAPLGCRPYGPQRCSEIFVTANFTSIIPVLSPESYHLTTKRKLSLGKNSWETVNSRVEFTRSSNPDATYGFEYTALGERKDLEMFSPCRAVKTSYFSYPDYGFEFVVDTRRNNSRKYGLRRERRVLYGGNEMNSWALEHPSLAAKYSLGVASDGQSAAILADDQPLLGLDRTTDESGATNFRLSTGNADEGRYRLLGGFKDHNNFNVTMLGPNDKFLARFLVSLKNNRQLVEKMAWDDELRIKIQELIENGAWQALTELQNLWDECEKDLSQIGNDVRSDEAFQAAASAIDTYVAPTVNRVRRNFAFSSAAAGAGSMGSSPCGGGGAFSSAAAGAGAGSQCGGSNNMFGSFAAAASSIQNQMNQVMQDMISKMQSRQAQSSSSSSTQIGGVFSVQYPQQVQAQPCQSAGYPSPCAAPAPVPAPQPSVQTHRIEFQIQPQIQPAPSPCSSSRSAAQEPGCVMSQPVSSYPAPSPSYAAPSGGYPSPYPAPSPSYGVPASGAAVGGGYPAYSTNIHSQPSGPVDAYVPQAYAAVPQPSYAPSPQPYAAASQPVPSYAAAPSYPAPANGRTGQSFTVPMGNAQLTINIQSLGQQPQPQPAPAPAPQFMASGSSRNDYMASGSQQQQYVVSGALPYGSSAQGRLGYCTPGSTEKGICFTEGENSLEPTRAKRSTTEEEALSTFDQLLLKVVQMREQFVEFWNWIAEQPETRYLAKMRDRLLAEIEEDVRTLVGELAGMRPDEGATVSLMPAYEIARNGSVYEVTSTTLLPFSVTSLREPELLVLNRIPFRYPTGIATLNIDNNTITTFDGTTYQFKADSCRYLFAHEFKGLSLTVLLQYSNVDNGNGTLDRIIVTRGKEAPVEIAPPWHGSRVVSGADDEWEILYNSKQRILSVQVNHGMKIAGLAGNFDGRKGNDFMLPTRNFASSDVQTFVSGWKTDDC